MKGEKYEKERAQLMVFPKTNEICFNTSINFGEVYITFYLGKLSILNTNRFNIEKSENNNNFSSYYSCALIIETISILAGP